MGKKLKDPRLTQNFIKTLFEYDSETGIFKKRVGWKKGQEVGSSVVIRGKSYVLVSVTFDRYDTKLYLAHQLAYLYVYGYIPDEIDHINGPSNRIGNLRKCTHSENMQNQGRRKDNTSGFKGVRKRNRKWIAIIHVQKDGQSVPKWLGTFNTTEEAHSAYQNAARRYYGQFSRTR